MFVEVPEPVWKTSIGNWSSNSPAATRSAAAAIRSARSGSSRPSSALTRAAAALIWASQRTTRHGDGLAGDREVGDSLGRLAAPQLLFLLQAHDVLSHSFTRDAMNASARVRAASGCARRAGRFPSAAERDQLARHRHGVVVGDQKARLRQRAQLRLGEQVQRLGGRPPGDARDPPRPTAAAPACASRDRRRAAGSGPPPASAARTWPTSAPGCRCRRRRRRRGGRDRAPPSCPGPTAARPPSGRKTQLGPVGHHPVQAGQRRHAAGHPPRRSLGAELVAAVQPVGHQHEPAGLQPPGADRQQRELGAEVVAGDDAARSADLAAEARRSHRRASRASRGGAGGPRSRRAAAGRAARRESASTAARRPAPTRGETAPASAAAPARGPPRSPDRPPALRPDGGRGEVALSGSCQS